MAGNRLLLRYPAEATGYWFGFCRETQKHTLSVDGVLLKLLFSKKEPVAKGLKVGDSILLSLVCEDGVFLKSLEKV